MEKITFKDIIAFVIGVIAIWWCIIIGSEYVEWATVNFANFAAIMAFSLVLMLWVAVVWFRYLIDFN